nr:immunoglobulin heavy chain junction region [Mus musculus]MBK4186041.1 immunoglobulin heavy chain junction region [Mus musculus]MBK4186042.1 immunoglobulin heavy chain junction region [Mus musculus]MBK4186043.1 immunoglobulin heavy chain junction region [Mus musculus]MBK4186044.1 immunoglobulin heavy chain junction region [Mus musculus]
CARSGDYDGFDYW